MTQVGRDELVAFLVESRRHGYAGRGARSTIGSLRRYEHRDGPFHYVDEYTGNVRDAGWERILHDGRPLWAMAYFGGMTAADADRPAVFRFLRECLADPVPALPLRGPRRAQSGSLEYEFSATGHLGHFQGRETIRDGGRLVYDRAVVGGAILETAWTSPLATEITWHHDSPTGRAGGERQR